MRLKNGLEYLIKKFVLGELIVCAFIAVTIGSCNVGSYYKTKSHLINTAVKESIKLEKSEELYKTPSERIMDSFEFLYFRIGPKIAEKRFKAGKFDETIRKYKPDYHNNS